MLAVFLAGQPPRDGQSALCSEDRDSRVLPDTVCKVWGVRATGQSVKGGDVQGSRGRGWRHFYPGILLERALSLPVFSVP